jgi:hypothetical protein
VNLNNFEMKESKKIDWLVPGAPKIKKRLTSDKLMSLGIMRLKCRLFWK